MQLKHHPLHSTIIETMHKKKLRAEAILPQFAPVTLVAASDNGRYLLVESDRALQVLDRAEKSQVATCAFDPFDAICAAAFIEETTEVVLCNGRGFCRWNWNSSDSLQVIHSLGTNGIFAAAFSMEPGLLVSSNRDNTLQMLEFHSNRQLWIVSVGHHSRRPTAVAISPDARVLASVTSFGDDSHVRLWAVEDGTCVRENNGPSSDVRFSEDGNLIFTANCDGVVCWHLQKDAAKWSTTFDVPMDGVRLIVFRNEVIAIGVLPTMHFFSAETGLRTRLPVPLTGGISNRRVRIVAGPDPHLLLESERHIFRFDLSET